LLPAEDDHQKADAVAEAGDQVAPGRVRQLS